MPEGDSGLAQIVGGHLNIDTVTNADANKILSHFTRDVCQYFVSVGKSDTEHGTGQNLGHAACQLNWFFFRHFYIYSRNNSFSRPGDYLVRCA